MKNGIDNICLISGMIEIRYICLNVHVYVRIYFILDFSEHENRNTVDPRLSGTSLFRKFVTRNKIPFPVTVYSKFHVFLFRLFGKLRLV